MMPPLITVGSSPPASSKRGDQRGRRGLAVGAGDRDAPFEPHQLGQHLGAAHDRQPLGARGDDLRIVGLTAEETTTTSASPRFSARVADGDVDAEARAGA